MKHIRRFLESNESHLDLLEYFVDLDDKYDMHLEQDYVYLMKTELSIEIKFDSTKFVQNNYSPREIIGDVWNCISMVRSIGDFKTSGSIYNRGLPSSKRETIYANLDWEFFINRPGWPNKNRQARLEEIPNRDKRIAIGDSDLSNFDSLMGRIREEAKINLKKSAKVGEFMEEVTKRDCEYLDSDFEDDLVINRICIYFKHETH